MKTGNPGSMRTSPLIAIAAISAMVLGVVGAAVITGVLPNQTSPKQSGIAMANSNSTAQAQIANCALCGIVESIRTVEIRDEAAALGGGLAGAPIGNDGSTTILRTDGAAASGSETGTSVKRRYAYRVTVRMDDGSYRSVSLSSTPALAVGDKVRVVEGKLVRA